MWVARDRNENLMFWDCNEKPKRICDTTWACGVRGIGYLQENWFPNLSWTDDPIQVELDTRKNLIKRFEILHMQYELTSREFFEKNPGKGFMSFDEYAMNNWDKVDMNYFNTIM